MIKSILNISTKNSLVFYYSMYLVGTFCINILLISIVAFFHFLLDHNISIIESWINRNSWEIVIISKMISLLVIIKALSLKSYDGNKFFDFIRHKTFFPERKSLIITIFSITMYAAFLQDQKVNPQSTYFIYLQILSFVGNSMYYFVDLLAFMYIFEFLKLGSLKNSFYNILAISLLNTFMSFGLIPTVGFSSVLIFVNTFLVLKLFDAKNFGNALFYLIFHVSISCTVWGLDLIWKDAYSVYRNTDFNYFILPTVTLGVSLMYLKYTGQSKSDTVD